MPGNSQPSYYSDGSVRAPYNAGVRVLLDRLQERYGLDDQQKLTSTSDNFFEFRCGNVPLREYLNEFVLRYDDAETRADLQMNAIGMSSSA